MNQEQNHITTYDQITPASADGLKSLYAGLFKKVLTPNSSVIVEYGQNLLGLSDTTTVFETSPFEPFGIRSLELETHKKQQTKLSLKEATELALGALIRAEQRRQLEREAESKYWSEID